MSNGDETLTSMALYYRLSQSVSQRRVNRAVIVVGLREVVSIIRA